MTERFYCPDIGESADVELTGPEAHHLLHVLRLRAGERVELFDGAGCEATAEITVLSKRNVGLRVLETRQLPVDAGTSIVLATAVPKGDRFRWLVEKATELGVTRMVPLKTARSVVDPRSGKLDKLRQTVVAACKQCRRSRLMELDEPVEWSTFLDRWAGAGHVCVAHPEGEPLSPAEIARLQSDGQTVILAVGPEGGFTEEEITAARQAGARCVGLGSRILRIETAALALAALFALGQSALQPDSRETG